MKQNVVETLTGWIVIIIATLFVIFAYKSAGGSKTHGYTVNAKFQQIDGVMQGTDIRISGIKVGEVKTTSIDPQTFMAVVEMNIDSKISLPKDSSSQILSDGLLGGKYISISPGADTNILKPGEEIKYTQSSVNLETLIGKMIFNNNQSDHKN